MKDLYQIICIVDSKKFGVMLCAQCRSLKETYSLRCHESFLITDSFLSIYRNNDEYYGKCLALFKEESIDSQV